MKLQFDANQQFQIDAVAAVTNLFDGQPQGAPEYAVINLGEMGGLFAGQDRTELGVGNRLLLADNKLRTNLRAIQTHNDIDVADPAADPETWELFDIPANQPRRCPHFSVEMETGTGKTYVYLRTIFELSRRYGFQKFIIVMPSVAIREGVLKNFDITTEHFRALQTEYEEDCGVTFGKVPFTAFVRLTRIVDGMEQPIGRDTAEAVRASLVEQKMLDADGRIQAAFDPKRKGFKLDLPEAHLDLAPAVVDLLAAYQIERHIRRDRDEGTNRLKKEVTSRPEFQALWDRIKPKTTYRVEFETHQLVRRAVEGIKRMEKIDAPKIHVAAGQVRVAKGGVITTPVSVAEEQPVYGLRALPDILAYLQNETELTRSTLVRILKESGRLADVFQNPQRFLDQVAAILKHELHRLLVDGIKYERLPGPASEAEWEMLLLKNEELVNYLSALNVNKSVYEYVVYDSEVEREFAKKLDEREDIKLFVKLPAWFKVDTPVGEYNPDWAIIKHDNQALYLVRETKGTRDFLNLRTSEADKVRCGQRHFETLGVPFAVAVSADDV